MIRRFLLSISLLGMFFMAVPQPALAYDFFNSSNINCSKASGSTVCQAKNADPISGSGGLIIKITNIIAYIAGAAAIIVIVLGAIRYITSGSDTSVGSRIDDDVLNAKRTIASALVGIAVIVVAKVIITYVVEKLQ